MPANKYKPAILRPLTGIFDTRSNVDETPPGAFRWKQNFAINADGKLARAKGWVRFGDIYCPRNADWHDQGVPFEDREPITVLFPSTSNEGERRLFGGTKTRIILLEEAAGEWIHWDGYAAGDTSTSQTQRRFMFAELQNKVYFTNDLDEPGYIDLENIAGGPNVSPDLADAGEDDNGDPTTFDKARVVISWNDVILYMNTEEGGVRRHNRIRWSDLKNGVALTPNSPATSIANFQDLDYGHVILNAVPIGAALYIFTDRSIWRCIFTTTDAGDAVLDAVRVYYEPKNQAKCLAYPNSLISDGDTAWYGGRDGIYAYRPGYSTEPELREWLHRATPVIFSGDTAIDTGACASMIGEYHKDLNELHFSWPVYDPAAVPVDPGADVDCETYEPVQPEPGTGINRHTLVVNLKFETADYRDYGSTAMANFISDIELTGGCSQVAKLLAVNGDDWTIKELNSGQSRSVYTVGDTISVEPVESGYFSILRGVFPFQNYDVEKEINSFLAGVVPDDPTDTAVLRLRIGTSDVALDPNGANGRCAVLFHQLSNKPVACHYTRSAAQYIADNVRPDDSVNWTFFYRGAFLYYEITIAAADNTAPKTGGLTLSRFEVQARAL